MEEIINDTILTVIPNRENCIITLDEDLTPSKDTEYTFEFKVYKNNSTEEVPCVIKDVISSSQDVTTEWTNTTNTVKLKANTNTVFIDTEGSLEVTIETTIGDIKKAVYWNTIINTIEAPMLSLSASSQMFVKQDMYSDFEPDSIDITAQCIRCEISSWKYSINNGKTFNLIESGTNDIIISSNKLNIKNTSNLFDENNYIIIRAESDSGVSDNITITRIEDTDTFNVQLSNENHTFIADSNGMAYAQKIAIDVYAFKGTENVSATVGLIENIPDGMTITINNNNSLNPSINIEVDESFDTISGIISVPVTISGVVIKKTFSYSLVKEGASGESASYVWALPTTLFFKEKGGETSPEEIKITSELSNCTFKNWSYSVDGEIWNTITASNAGLTIDADYTLIITPSFSEFKNSDSISFKITADSPTNVLCYDVITITKLKDGDDAFTVILDNEAHTFIGNYDGYAINSSINISPIGYVGVNRVPIKIGTITGKPTGMKSTITNNNTENPIIKITVNTTMTSRSGAVTIPITATYNNITYSINKIFSYSLSLDGTPASSCKITTNTTTFLSTDGGNTYEPSTITLTPNFTLCNFSKWQYLNNGTWTDVVTGSNGMTVNNQKLLVSISTPLFNEVENGVLSIRLITDETGVTDIISLYKLSQIDGISTELENMKSEIEQTNNAWKATFSTSSANNLILDGDFNRAFEEIYWANAYSTTLSYKTVNAYPFYDDKQTLSVKFETSSSSLQYYQDIELMPNTDYVYQCYIHTDNSVETSNLKPLHFWIWEGDTPQAVTLCTIVDYSQNLTIGRYNLCYVHFKTDDVQNALHGRFFMFTNGTSTSANLTFRQCGLYQNTMPIKWTPSSNEIVTGITTIDHKGIKVEHSNVDTTTRMSADGFTIQDDNGDVLAWLSSKEQWTELKVDKVFANNVENVYTGESNLYVDHSKAVAGDGTSSKPFNSFAQLSRHLMENPIINKDIYVVVRDPGFAINEQLYLEGLKGAGFIKITLEGNLVINNAGSGQFCMRFHQIDKWIWIEGSREFGSNVTGAVLGDGGDGNGHGIYASDVDYLEVDAITIACKNWGIYTERTHLFTWHVDFGKTWCAIELTFMSLYYSSDDVGSCADFCRLKSGSFAYWGVGTVRPQGNVQAINGMYYDGGLSLTPTASPRFATTDPDPTPPSTSGQIFTYTYNCTSKQSYQYSWSNWSTDGSCKQGSWGYGLRGGHMFFDIATIRAEMAGTIQDGNTITLTRANSGGISGDANVYINGSSCSSASGTPSYSNQTHLGTLKWGETKTFTLPKAIVQNLVNGTCSSLAVYVNSTANNNYINITSASITLKTKK